MSDTGMMKAVTAEVYWEMFRAAVCKKNSHDGGREEAYREGKGRI